MKIKLLFSIIILFLSIVPPSAYSEDRPRIGLVLGGGGARGAAHIGVLEVLEEMRIPVDCVAGTSMGSLVAGSYASGVSIEEMKGMIREVDWVDIFTENTDAGLLDYRQRRLAQRFYPKLEMGVKEDGVQTPQGLVSGEKIKLFFNHLVHADVVERRIENLSLPLAIIATDLGDGSKVVFKDGNLTTAMRASMSVPGVMAPVTIDNHKLVDGGLVDNVPIDEARKLCQPDLVIAVDVGTPLLKPEEIDSALSVAAQMINILTYQNVGASLATLKPDDVFIQPDLDGISAGDFDRQFEAIARGRAAAKDPVMQAKLAKLSLDPEVYMAWQTQIRQPLPEPRAIDEIRIAETRYVNKDTIAAGIRIKPGEMVDTKSLNDHLLKIYGYGDYESIDYELLDERDRHILSVLPVEKSWGPDYLRFGMNLNSNFSDISSYNIRLAYQRTWMNSLGGEWLTTAQFGQNTGIVTEWYQPLSPNRTWFVRPGFSRESRKVELYENNDHYGDQRTYETDLRFDLGYTLGTRGQVYTGWLSRQIDSRVEVGSPELGDHRFRMHGLVFNFDGDTFDKIFFPTKGIGLHANVFHTISTSGNIDDYTKGVAVLDGVTGYGDYLLRMRLQASGALHGQVPFADAARLGGFHNLSGYAFDQIIGGKSYFGMLRLERKIGQMPIGLGGNLYAGLSAEAGRVDSRYTETGVDGWQPAGSLYLGGDTPFGPVYLGYGYARGGHSNFYLFVGTP